MGGDEDSSGDTEHSRLVGGLEQRREWKELGRGVAFENPCAPGIAINSLFTNTKIFVGEVGLWPN